MTNTTSHLRSKPYGPTTAGRLLLLTGSNGKPTLVAVENMKEWSRLTGFNIEFEKVWKIEPGMTKEQSLIVNDYHVLIHFDNSIEQALFQMSYNVSDYPS